MIFWWRKLRDQGKMRYIHMLENTGFQKLCSFYWLLLDSVIKCQSNKCGRSLTKNGRLTKQLSETFQSFVRKLKLKELFNQICLTADPLLCTNLSVCVRVCIRARYCSVYEKCVKKNQTKNKEINEFH